MFILFGILFYKGVMYGDEVDDPMEMPLRPGQPRYSKPD